jgi:hypothetical protein
VPVRQCRFIIQRFQMPSLRRAQLFDDTVQRTSALGKSLVFSLLRIAELTLPKSASKTTAAPFPRPSIEIGNSRIRLINLASF